MRFDVITLFPEMFEALNHGITRRAQQKQLMGFHTWNPRDFTQDKHKTVDDRPYGGGPGMLMKVEPLLAAIAAAKHACQSSAKIIYLAPHGKLLCQKELQKLTVQPGFILLCGRYEGIDQRVIDKEVDCCYSVGDYVLSGGELPAMVLIDALTRLIPGSLGHVDAADSDSFSDGLLEYPQYTRPELLQDMSVPDVLLSGHHAEIARWRRQQALGRTWALRPDLLQTIDLTETDKILLKQFIESFGVNHE